MTDAAAVSRLLKDLTSRNPAVGVKAAQALAVLRISSPEVVAALERAVVYNISPDVRAAALEALAGPGHRRVQWERRQAEQAVTALPLAALHAEIDKWLREGLIAPFTAALLRQRYPQEEPPEIPAEVEEILSEAPAPEPVSQTAAPEPVEPVAAQPVERPTLSQILLGETAIRVALYLGAFFVVAAAFIIAALVELARLPILSITTVSLLAAGWVLSRRLTTAGFVLFIAGALMIPIDAGVLVDLSRLAEPQSFGLWSAAFAISGVVWAAGAWRYRSPLFAWVAFASFDLAAFDLVQLQPHPEAIQFCLALAVAALGGALAAWVLRRGGGERYFLPLFVTVQLQAVGVAGVATLLAIIMLTSPSDTQPITWTYAAGTWLALAAFYGSTDLMVQPLMVRFSQDPTPVSLLRAAGTFCLLLVPILGVRALTPDLGVGAAVAWGWGAIMALASEGVSLTDQERLRGYGLSLLLAALPGLVMGILIAPSNEARLGYWLGSAAILTGLSIHRHRWWVWALGLTSWTGAYLTLFALPAVAALDLFTGYILVVPMAITLTAELLMRKRLMLSRGWTIPMLVAGLLFAAATGLVTLFSFGDEPASVAITYLVMTVFLTGYAVLDGWVLFWIAALAVAYLAYHAGVSAIHGLVAPLGWKYLPPGLIYLAIFYVTRRRLGLKPGWWWSALIMGGLAAAIDIALAFFEGGARPENIAAILLVWAAALAILVVIDDPKTWWWAGALVMAYAGYLEATQIEAVKALPVFDGFVHLLPAILFLGVDLVARLRFRAGVWWRVPPLALAGIAGLITVAVTTLGGSDVPARGVAIYAIATAVLLVYAALTLADVPAFLAAAAGVAAFTYVIAPWIRPEPGWATQNTFLAAGYYALGVLVLALIPAAPPWLKLLARAWYWTGLALGGLASVILFFEAGSTLAVIGVALVATCVVIEAFRRRNIWLGYPANVLYLISYFLALRVLTVTEPQFFTVGAALLGLIMHYLLVRNQNRGAAFATGLISQLLLQSTSYIQMVSTQQLEFFAALFFESLAVMVYGLVIRSRSLLFIPIGFLIVGTATVAFTLLKGLSTAAIIGVTGIVLLLLGILALLMRERLTRLIAILNTWEP